MADATTLSHAFMRSHPAEAARVLEAVSSSESSELFAQVPARICGAVLAEMLPRTAARIVRELAPDRATEVLTHLGPQPSAAILRHVEEPTRSRLIGGMPTAAALVTKLLLEYVDDSVGSCMDPNVIALSGAVRAREALERLRHAEAGVDRVFVVGAERRLLGWVPLDRLMRAPEGVRLESLIVESAARLAAHSSLNGARAHPGWQTASVLPIVGRGDRLLGVLSREALHRASERIHRTAMREAGPDESLPGVLVRGYWEGLSGILQILATCLPTARPIGSSDHER